MGIVTVTLLAFIAAGIGVVYQIERLPLLSATAIHAGALYLDYLLIYLLNNWIPRDWAFIGVFTLCFAVATPCPGESFCFPSGTEPTVSTAICGEENDEKTVS